MIEWKNPFDAILATEKLIQKGICITLNILGEGNLYKPIKDYVEEKQLQNNIIFHGNKTYEEVQSYYLNSDIFLFTSDNGEGWGAVLNEAMSNGLLIVASDLAGSSKSLIDNFENGVIYQCFNVSDLSDKIEYLINLNIKDKKKMSYKAFLTIKNLWSGKIAAERLINFYKSNSKFETGPISEPKLKKINS